MLYIVTNTHHSALMPTVLSSSILSCLTYSHKPHII